VQFDYTIHSDITICLSIGSQSHNLLNCPFLSVSSFYGFQAFRKASWTDNVATVAGQKTLSGSVFWTFPNGVCLVYIFLSFYMCLWTDINPSLFLCKVCICSNSFCYMHCISPVSSQLCLRICHILERHFLAYLLTGLLTGCGCTWYHHPDLQTFTINPTLSCSHRTCRHSVFKEVHLTFSSDI